MLTKVEKNKLEKKESLLNATYELLSEKEIEEITIDNISEKADVAKGTFYLYFKNKTNIYDELKLLKSEEVISKSIINTINKDYMTFEDLLDELMKNIIENLSEDTVLAKLLHKDLTLGIYDLKFKSSEILDDFYNLLNKKYTNEKLTIEDLKIKIFMGIDISSSIAYNLVVLNLPLDMRYTRDVLKRMVS